MESTLGIWDQIRLVGGYPMRKRGIIWLQSTSLINPFLVVPNFRNLS
jgi:hypothetical protein